MENLNVSFPCVMMMSILCGIFELKIHYSTQIEISKSGINGGKYYLGNCEFTWFVNDESIN